MQSPSRHLHSNPDDRELGKLWEQQFCRLAAWYGKAFVPQQIGRDTAARWYTGSNAALLPDITIFSAPGEHHEIKHKNPTPDYRPRLRSYGYEAYRLRPLLIFRRVTQQPVLYTVHDWELAGVKHSDVPMPNIVHHWRTVDVLTLEAYLKDHHIPPERVDTWLNGEKAKCLGYYWPVNIWIALDAWWGLPA
jgi:hypothetical protein